MFWHLWKDTRHFQAWVKECVFKINFNELYIISFSFRSGIKPDRSNQLKILIWASLMKKPKEIRTKSIKIESPNILLSAVFCVFVC